MTKSEYALMKERKWLEEDENVCVEMRKQIGEGKNVGYPDRYFLERLGYIYSEQERLQLFEDEYNGKDSSISTETRIDIPEGYGRYWFDCVRDSNGQIIKILLVIGRSEDRADSGTYISENMDDVEEICSLEIRSIKSARHLAKEFLKLITWMEENGYAEQKGNGTGDDLAT